MFTRLDTVILYVKDVNLSKKFYVEKLGFVIDRDEGNYVSLKVSPDDVVRIALNAEGKRGQFPGHQTIVVTSMHIEKVRQKVKAAKIPIAMDLVTKSWGKTFIFTDPD